MNPYSFIKSLLGNTESELYLRALDGLINEHEDTALHGFKNVRAAECFVGGLLLFRDRIDKMSFQADYSYIADFSLCRLLACWQHENLWTDIEDLYGLFLEILSKTKYSHENDIYIEAFEMAKAGQIFDGRSLGPKLLIKLLE